MTTSQRLNPSALYRDAPYDYAAVAPTERLVCTAGACPLDRDGAIVAPGDLEGQARRTLDNLELALAEAGARFEHVLKTTVYVAGAERADLVRVWTVVAERFGDARPPSTLLGVSFLGYPEQLVEIEAIGFVP
jgi:enamine deaminase RidA (YjgF/YER057c/UK114 family)